MKVPSPTKKKKWHSFSASSLALTFKATRPLYCYGEDANVSRNPKVSPSLGLNPSLPYCSSIGLGSGNNRRAKWGQLANETVGLGTVTSRTGRRTDWGRERGPRGYCVRGAMYLSLQSSQFPCLPPYPDSRTLQTSTSRGPNFRPCPFPSP